MNFLKNPQTAVITLVLLAIAVFFTWLSLAGGPSDSFVKNVISKQMEKRLKGGSIASITVVRGNTFLCEAHFSKVPHGTPLYPRMVTVNYTTKLPDGSLSENKTFSRTLSFYKDFSHQWAVDDDLH